MPGGRGSHSAAVPFGKWHCPGPKPMAQKATTRISPDGSSAAYGLYTCASEPLSSEDVAVKFVLVAGRVGLPMVLGW